MCLKDLTQGERERETERESEREREASMSQVRRERAAAALWTFGFQVGRASPVFCLLIINTAVSTLFYSSSALAHHFPDLPDNRWDVPT